MKKGFIAIILIMILFVPSASAKPERYVKDNVFTSSHPRLSLQIDRKFTYVGPLDYRIQTKSPNTLDAVAYDTRSYVFIESVKTTVKTAFYIQIRREQTKYIGNLFGNIKADLRSGVCSLGEDDYTCFTRVIIPSRGEPLAQFLLEKGYVVPDCVLTRAYARFDTSDNNYLLIISYNEDLSGSGWDCNTWQNKNHLSKEQAQYLDRFEQNCRASFSIVKKGFGQRGKSRAYEDGESILQKAFQPRDSP